VSAVRNASASITSTSFEPLPSVIAPGEQPCFAASACFSAWPLPSGYKPISAAAAAIALRARGPGPNGFSFEASLMLSLMPYSRSSSSIGLPGTYGAMPRTPGAISDVGSKDIGLRAAGLELCAWAERARTQFGLLAGAPRPEPHGFQSTAHG